MRHYLPGLGRFISRVHLHQAVAMGKTTYEELREERGINIGPPGTSDAFARNSVPEHHYAYAESNPANWVDPPGLQPHRPCAATVPLRFSCDPPAIVPWWLKLFAGFVFGHYQRVCATDLCPLFCSQNYGGPESLDPKHDDCIRACETLLAGGGSTPCSRTYDGRPIKCECTSRTVRGGALERHCVCENMPPRSY